MARHVKTYTVEKSNRDKGKSFVITEMPPRAGHAWATKALFAMLNSGVEIPDELAQQGWAGLAVVGLGGLSRIPYAVAGPMLDELFDCVQIKLDRSTRALVDEDVEEIPTLFELQKEVLTLHISPFTSGDNRTSESSPTTQKPTS